MGLTPILLVGPFLAVVGVVSVIIVMRHKAIQTKSMYSSRRQAIERKVRAARQRTLAPVKHDEKAAGAPAAPASAPGGPTFAPSAFEGPPVAPPSYNPTAPPPPVFEPASPASGPQPWEVGPTAPPPPPPVPIIVPVPPPEPVWTPSVEPETRPLVETPAGAGASWSIVGEAKEEPRLEAGKKKKKRKDGAGAVGGWQLASGDDPNAFYEEEEIKRPSAAMAIAQYAVLVVGLVMVLIGVLVMVANSQVT
jgi:hypothetical protein